MTMSKNNDTEQQSKERENFKKLVEHARKLGPVEERPGEVHAILFLNPKRHTPPEEPEKK
jgi:hypothetical protein